MESKCYAFELYFDPALENQVLKSWNVLALRHISTYLIDIHSRPHITLCTVTAELSKLQSFLKNFASKQKPLCISLSTIGSFPKDNNILFLAPTPSHSLLQFHSQLCEAMKKDGIQICGEHLTGSWVPYCAVAQEVPKERMGEAFCALRDSKLPVIGYATDIGFVDSSSGDEFFSFVLGDTER